jgi:hypothetical protein
MDETTGDMDDIPWMFFLCLGWKLRMVILLKQHLGIQWWLWGDHMIISLIEHGDLPWNIGI